MRTSIAAPLLLLLSFAAAPIAPLRAQVTGPCPNERASSVPGEAKYLGPWRTCFLQIHVFGIVLEIPFARCPTGHIQIPAHDECLGQVALGSLCEEAGVVPIELALCRCVPHSGPLYSFSTCECRDMGAMGFVSVGQTVLCQ